MEASIDPRLLLMIPAAFLIGGLVQMWRNRK